MADGYRSQVSRGPFIYMTSGQMATADNRFIYEVYLCSHQELKWIKVVKCDNWGPQNNMATLHTGVKRYKSKMLREWAALSHLN